jgi:hypothetical protein
LEMVLRRSSKERFTRLEELCCLRRELFFHSFAFKDAFCSLEKGYHPQTERTGFQEAFRVFRFQCDFPRPGVSGAVRYGLCRYNFSFSHGNSRSNIFCVLGAPAVNFGGAFSFCNYFIDLTYV